MTSAVPPTSAPIAAIVPDGASLLLRHPPFAFYVASRSFSRFSSQIAAVAVGWQIYDLTGSAFQLGMVGLVQFLPMLLLVFAGGHAADRYDRRRVVQLCQIAQGLAAAYLAWGSFAGWITVPEIFAAVAVFGAATAFESPAGAALLPAVAPDGTMQKATALTTGIYQLATIGGPALGGVAFAVSPGLPYALMAGFWVLGGLLNSAIKLERQVVAGDPPSLRAMFAGVGFVRRNPAIFGTISLDLFAVLLGGAVALLPIYARDILQTGPWGLGILRAAPAVGALLMTVVLARTSIKRRVGMRMFQAVIVFGLATSVFAVSEWVWLSLIALAIMGAADTVSVVIRVSLVQLQTPDEMRGRVGAVNYLFINASNQLGQFESGLTAALFGTMPAALLGGIGTVAVALLWMKLFPTLRDLERLE
ncbi:MFS transporter [Tardiphaga sp. vice352]|uniref:MFS transporter n=1 Tax=unclassified Tardiphaga TaxID=2631404 RepID=UPI0011644934|nr:MULTISPECIES: MFS transporter [unclassified Tardiphaga]QDM16964.1 MFS transporter [Tardiphaga sp. vice278]QDM21946.1 MFS transporter [Tardiphaga sp. vice154]QDM27200.1 MFS transporter [Tardiphaga sp. vice304]QDM32325.1 MFS transporter [Tardiphaga sp. vice352]